MTLAAYVLCSALAGDAAPAGAAYTRGVHLLGQKNFEEAAAAFEEALRHEPVEAETIRYRDGYGRHRHSYWPRFLLGCARFEQASRENAPYVKRGHLQEAIRNLRLTEHADAPARLAEAETALEQLEKAIAEAEASAVPPELAQLKARVDQLCEASSFEEALQAILDASELLRRYERVKNDLVATTRNRQRATLRNYETLLTSRLDSISRTDPTYESEIVLPLLKPARVPDTVMKDPEARFRWLVDFCAVYERELPIVRAAGTLDPAKILPSAEAFDALGRQALQIDLFNGFRAARNMAHAMRMARLKELALAADKPDSVLPGTAGFKADTAKLLESLDASRIRAEKDLAARVSASTAVSDELKKYIETDLPYQKRQIEAVFGKVREVTVAYDRRVSAEASAKTAEDGILTPGRMSDPAEARKISRALSQLESEAYFETLPAPVRARVLFARAVSEAVGAFLEADPPARVAEKVRGDVLRASGLDPGVAKPWLDGGRLSPRLSVLFDQIRRQ
jgi:hypothetical protein